MPQFNLTVNDSEVQGALALALDSRDNAPMQTIQIDNDWLTPAPGEQIFSASSLTLNLPRRPRRFFRHGWQSWTLSTWLDPSEPPLPIRSAQFRAKDEDPLYAFSKNHVSAWVASVELDESQVILLGALDLGGRIELDGVSLKGFYETGSGEWFLARGPEDEVFKKYADRLATKFGKTRFAKAPRVWCSWYSLYKWINEPVILKILKDLGDLPFDVFQLDDGWQDESGNWDAGKNFPSGMAALAEKIKATGRTAGLWLSPLIITPNLTLFREHPDWLLRDERGDLVKTGLNWTGQTYALDVTHPVVLDWLDKLIRKVVGWGYGYLKLDFLYAGAAAGKRYKDIPREQAYREALKVMRQAAGNAYLLACGAPIIPSLGLCDGLRVGPDVTPYWLNKPLSVWLNNPNNPSTQNAIRTCLHMLWLQPVVNTDPDVVYFRSRHNRMTDAQKKYLQDLGTIARFKATSDLPQWLNKSEREALRKYLEEEPEVKKTGRYQYRIGDRQVDFSSIMPIPPSRNVPAKLAQNLGLMDLVVNEALPAIFESRKK
jgi:alpha-galactosidase